MLDTKENKASYDHCFKAQGVACPESLSLSLINEVGTSLSILRYPMDQSALFPLSPKMPSMTSL